MNQPSHLRQSTLDKLHSIESLPTLPDLFIRIQGVLNDSSSSLQDLTKVIESDQATAATLVKVANSSYYNPLGKPANSLSFAISRLGRDETSRISLSMSLIYGFSMPAGIATIKKFWAHAYATGQIARKLALSYPEHPELNPDLLFLTGLLHDIGKAIIGIRIDTHYFEKNFAQLHGTELTLAEEEAYGVGHAEVGSIVLKQWGLPATIHEHVFAHHGQSKSITLNIIHLSDDLAHQYFPSASTIEDVERIYHGDEFNTAFENIMAEKKNAPET